MKIIKFKAHHLDNFEYQKSQEYVAATWDAETRSYVEMTGDAWSVIHDGIIIFCGGFIDMGFGRALAWSLVSKHAAKHLYFITKNTLAKFEKSGFKRLEMIIDSDFEHGHRWARMLGFNLETPDGMPHYYLDKKTFLYGRIL